MVARFVEVADREDFFGCGARYVPNRQFLRKREKNQWSPQVESATGEEIHKALAAGASAAALGTRFVATIESSAHPDYKRAILAADAKDTALTICFQDGWSATHRVLRNRTFVMWDAAGCASPGKRPGEGDAIATKADGSKILRYQAWSPVRGFGGAVTECPCGLVRALSSSKDLARRR
jgi:hypothetical protein